MTARTAFKTCFALAACAAFAAFCWLSATPKRETHPASTAHGTRGLAMRMAATAPRAPSAAAPRPRLVPPRLDEPELMAELRRADARDPLLSLVLARDGNARFPNSPEAAERAALAIKSLALTGHLSEARGEAEFMVNHYPASHWTEEVEQHTGAHPHRALARLP